MLKFPKNSKYASIALYAGITIVICAVVIMLLVNFSSTLNALKFLLRLISPILYGFAFAYLINPIVVVFENKVFKFKHAKRNPARLRRILSLTVSILLVLLVFSLLIYSVVPAAVNSFEDFSGNLNSYVNNAQKFADDLVANHSSKFFNQDYSSLSELLKAYDIDFSLSTITSSAVSMLKSAFTSLISVASETVGQVINVLIGLILMVWFLYDKEKLTGQIKKIIASFTSQRGLINTVRFFRYTNKAFGGFISGKIIDSVIIGILAFVLLLICRIKYAPLLAVLIGVTNFVPTFGPIIGGVIGGVLVALASPEKIIPFIILVLIIQQLDGNIIGPLILGESIGINAMWIIIAIVIGNGIYGVLGIILSVPICAVLYTLIKQGVEKKLKSKNMPFHTEFYESYPSTEGESNEYIAFIEKDDYFKEITLEDDISNTTSKRKLPLFQRIKEYSQNKKRKKTK